MDEATRARLQLCAAALLFSTGGAAIKLCALSSWQVVSLRSAIAVPVLLALMPAAVRGWSWRAPLVGVAYAGTVICFVAANKLTTSANAIFLQSTAPLYLLLLGPWLLREPLRRRDLLHMAALAAGMALFFAGADAPSATAPDPWRGNAFAAFSGATWAATMLGLRWMSTRGHGGAGAAVIAGNAIACFACLPAALPLPAAVAAADWLLIAYLGVFQLGLAYVCMTAGMRHVAALEASLLVLLEPVFNPVWSWAIHGERPGPWPLLGGAIIVLATVIKTGLDTRGRR